MTDAFVDEVKESFDRLMREITVLAGDQDEGANLLLRQADAVEELVTLLRAVGRKLEKSAGLLQKTVDLLTAIEWADPREHVETEIPTGRRHLANLTDEEVLDLLDKLERWTLRYHAQNRGQHPTVRRAAGYMQMNHQDLWALTTFSPYLDTRQQRNTSGVGHRLIVDTRAK